jgi:hypothetical protein
MTIIRCAAFESRLAEFMEGDLPPADAAEMQTHADGCDRCGALVAGIRRIASEARKLPLIQPERDLWLTVASRIEAPVVVLEKDAASRRRGISWRAAAAAAAVLIGATALTTYQLSLGSRQPVVTAQAPVDTQAPASTLPELTGSTAQLPADPTDSAAIPSRPAGTPVRQASVTSAPAVDPVSMVSGVYERDIANLRTLLDRQRGALDSTTVVIIEKNLRVIDEAIQQSRQALRNDPNSAFLLDQLNGALGQKVELLRTATQLHASS